MTGFELHNERSLQWRRMNIMASQITNNSAVFSNHFKENIKALCGESPVMSGFPSHGANNAEHVS